MRDSLPNLADTIVAIASPPSPGDRGILRLSGDQAHALAQQLGATFASPNRAGISCISLHLPGWPKVPAWCLRFHGPRSFTGEDVVELHTFGSLPLLQALQERLLALGARAAQRGEFSLRAFLNGRVELSQAEAIAEIIAAKSPRESQAGVGTLTGALQQEITSLTDRVLRLIMRLEMELDFSEEDPGIDIPAALSAEAVALCEALQTLSAKAAPAASLDGAIPDIVLTGPPNAGKSAWLNCVTGNRRAVVTNVPGTTRDSIAVELIVDGFTARLHDTAGLRAADGLEADAIDRARRRLREASAVVVCLDGSTPLDTAFMADASALIPNDVPTLHLQTKLDKPSCWEPAQTNLADAEWLRSSARKGAGREAFLHWVAAVCRGELTVQSPRVAPVDAPFTINPRQAHHLAAAASLLAETRDLLAAAAMWDAAAQLLTEARGHLEAIAGRDLSEDVLAGIFGSFCIGK